MINTVEALLFGAGRPLRLSEIRTLLESDGISAELSDIKQCINQLEERFELSSLEVTEVASGFRLQIKKAFSPSLTHLWNERTPRISKALMETISIIAYKQPVTRGDIEDIRGVSVSTQSIRTLLERNWIKVSGFKDAPGKPALYSTTKEFLDDLDMKSLSNLPELPDLIETDQDQILSQVV
jgi:segregation and condensation protein B|tara:strand:+ start:293 stop:838 length:546 start_codon:yes stop_codon:yes gene_type:complete